MAGRFRRDVCRTREGRGPVGQTVRCQLGPYPAEFELCVGSTKERGHKFDEAGLLKAKRPTRQRQHNVLSSRLVVSTKTLRDFVDVAAKGHFGHTVVWTSRNNKKPCRDLHRVATTAAGVHHRPELFYAPPERTRIRTKPSDVPAVSVACSQLQHPRAARCDPDRRRWRRYHYGRAAEL